MANLNTTISEFLRDAQYRVSKLSIEMNAMKKRRRGYDKLHDLRAQLLLWMDLLYESRDSIYTPEFNYLGGWTERQIIGECEYLRSISGMATIAYITFAGYNPVVRNVITGIEGNIPAGTENQYLRYDANGNLIAEDFPSIAGMQGETITQYFN